MNDLIKVIENAGKQWVDARDLHERIEVGKDFSNWIKDRIKKYGFLEKEDFQKLDSPNLANQDGWGGDRRSVDYLLSLNMAKELCMVENNATGRAIRRYLIKLEEAWRDPDVVLKQAQKLGVIPAFAKKPQIDDRSFNYALWLYSIGAISQDDLNRFRLGADAKIDSSKLQLSPFHPKYNRYINGLVAFNQLKEADFPMSVFKLAKILNEPSHSRDLCPMRRTAKYETSFDYNRLSREECIEVIEKYFKDQNDFFLKNYETNNFLHCPDGRTLFPLLKQHEKTVEDSKELEAVFSWPQLSREVLGEVVKLYEAGKWNAAAVREYLFSGQPDPDAVLRIEHK